MHIVMVAAENGALKGGKVGGIGDVIRDVPQALARLGHQVSVITPGYQMLPMLNPSSPLGTVQTRFCGRQEDVELFLAGSPRVPQSVKKAPESAGRVDNFLLDHPLFAACGAGSIYCNDQRGPFATDAHKFALFCAACCELLRGEQLGEVDVIHIHDWHGAMLALMRSYSPDCARLRTIPLVYTIHNLSLQGVRPLRHDESSPQNWFPELPMDLSLVQDPRYRDCINLMRAALRHADRVHAVSPSYAREILRPSDPDTGFVGGEGLEADLQLLEREGRLSGILNGCDYDYTPPALADRAENYNLVEATLRNWVLGRDQVPAAHFHALALLQRWRKRRKPFAVKLTSVGRITEQKVRLLLQPVRNQQGQQVSALEQILDELKDGVFVMLGSGEEHYERFFTRVMAGRDNFLFLCGFSEELAEALYVLGDVFLMPSSYEPCGISQMLAMRVGTPCVVHDVGGLSDTVQHGVNGFCFGGSTTAEQTEQMLESVRQALALMKEPEKWQAMRHRAAASRFSWQDSVEQYVSRLYRF